ncbi:MAG TPA: hypothetical protein VK859_13455 [bacterium]|jgi:uncharacterized coiled-coil DUF342 family protein|nr:hypothetical protein [bacterium]
MGEQRDAYVEKFKVKLDEWNSEIDELQAKANGAHQEVLVSLNKQIAVLKEKRDDLKGRMEELRKRGDDAWEDLREGIGTAWKALGDSIDDAKSRFK